MSRYIISVSGGAAFNAASKARRDAEAVAAGMGYLPFPFEGGRTGDGRPGAALRLALEGAGHWRALIRRAEPGSLILLQYPHFPLKSARLVRRLLPLAQKRKGLKFIALVHDLDSLRRAFGRAAIYSDGQLLPRFDAVICHNESMRACLAARGIDGGRLVTLGIFDYLTDAPIPPRTRTDGVAVAGNLDPEKCGYVRHLVRLASAGCPVHLYGQRLDTDGLPAHVTHHGACPPDALPGQLRGAFGLVWDGPDADACIGASGEYLRYNNPHKLSLYLASGMPALIWQEAAQARFVAEHGAGLLLPALNAIPDTLARVTDGDYRRMRQNALALGRALRAGEYTRRAIAAAEAIVLKK